MQDVQDPPHSLKTVTDSLSSPSEDWLKWSEYGSLGLSAFGSLIAALSGQILYAAAPLTVALSLNLVNRQRFQEQTRQYLLSEIADIHGVVESFYQHHHISASEDMSASFPIDEHLESPELEPITEAISQLQRTVRKLDDNVLRRDDWETLNLRFLIIDESVTELKTITQDLQSSLGTGERENLSPTELTSLQTKIGELEQKVNHLEHQNKHIVKPYLKGLTKTIQKLSISPISSETD